MTKHLTELNQKEINSVSGMKIIPGLEKNNRMPSINRAWLGKWLNSKLF